MYSYSIHIFLLLLQLFFGYNVSYKLIDRGLVEMIGPEGLRRVILQISNFLSNVQSGVIYQYAVNPPYVIYPYVFDSLTIH